MVRLVVCLVLIGACTSLAGLDGDYVLGESTPAGTGGSVSSTVGATTGGAMPSAGGAAGNAAGGGEPACVEGTVHVAVVADCIAVAAPDPDACAAALIPGSMVIDLIKEELGNVEAHAFLRFDLGRVPGGLASLELQLAVSDATDAPSVSTGEIWRVAPFVREDLFTLVPANVGQAPLGGDQGTAAHGATIRWMLPPDAIDDSGSLFLAVRPVSDDGVEYYNITGAVPPRIIVHCL